MLFEMAMGELPFRGGPSSSSPPRSSASPPQPLPPHVPAMIRSVILRCLSKDPAHRYQRAGEARAALEAIQSDITIPRPPGPSAAPVPRLRRIGAAVAAIAIAIAAVVWFQASRGPAGRAAPATGRLTLAVGSSDAPIFDPAISGDGKMLSYAAEDGDGQIDLFVRRVAGGAVVKLTNDAARESSPRFSPDGERILFTRRESADGVPELRIVPALGGDAIASVAAAAGGVWSADGQRLAFLRRTAAGGTALTVASADGSNARAVLESDSSYPFLRGPAWAPDGRDVAIVRGTGGIAGEIWLVPAAGGAPRRPFSDPPEVFSDSPVFTADGLMLIHSSNRGGATNLWSYPTSGGAPVRLTTGPGPDTGPSVAADGTHRLHQLAVAQHGGNPRPRRRSPANPHDPLAVPVGAGVLARQQGGRLQPQRSRRIVAHLDGAGRRRRAPPSDVERCRRGLSAIQPGRTLRVVPHLADTAANRAGVARGRRGRIADFRRQRRVSGAVARWRADRHDPHGR